ncbi:MAG TPA: citramalate synthase, partial [Opitutales bacterium]|nr:citramalate synthase [Opitutales bacterium]
MNNDNLNVLVYDTTLRDGTQGEGVSFSVSAKLALARRMDEFGIDTIEGGWPGSNPRDMAFFEEIRKVPLSHAKVAAFGSTRRAGTPVAVDAQVQMLLDAQTPVVTIFGKTWLLHVTEVLHTTAEENLAMIEDTVSHLVANGREVVYDAEHFFDGFADDPAYALATLDAAAKGGATCLTLCDTNGGTMPKTLGEVVKTVVNRFPKIRVGMHCHNDCGMAVALTLVGVDCGATLVQGTLNGYGERTGNANLTTIIPNLALKMGKALNCSANIKNLRKFSLYADDLANLNPDSKQPYVGASAFAHKGGVHANAAKKVARSYEHVEPGTVGNRQRILLSDMSGASSVVMKAKQLGIDLDEKSPKMKEFLAILKEREFQGYEYENADASLEVLMRRHFQALGDVFKLRVYRVITEVDRRSGEVLSEAAVKVLVNGEEFHTVAESDGPVSALDHAMRKALIPLFPVLANVKLLDYKVRILDTGKGTDSTVRVLVMSSDGTKTWWTTGASPNIIEASYQ